MANSTNTKSNSNRSQSSQPMLSGWMDSAREHPVAAAAAVGGAVAAGAFLWSKRSQIGDGMGKMSGQISEWSESMSSKGSNGSSGMSGGRTASSSNMEMAGSPTSSAGTTGGRSTTPRTGQRETGQSKSPAQGGPQPINSTY